jgi:hypothetical protein
MTRKVNYIPSLALLQSIQEAGPGDTVLQNPQLDRDPGSAGKLPDQRPQRLPLSAQV